MQAVHKHVFKCIDMSVRGVFAIQSEDVDGDGELKP